MPDSQAIFADTSFWIALRIPRDTRHDEARKLFSRHGDTPLVTTSHVLGEVWTLVRRRAGHRAAVHMIDRLTDSPRLAIEHMSATIESEALTWLRRHDERLYSFVDATSFAYMRSERIASALAFDGDFSAAGFVELRA